MKSDTCATCGGHLQARRITVDRRIEGRLVVFEDVPARVCEDCSDVWLDSDVLEAMEAAISQQGGKWRTIEVPAISLINHKAA